MTTRIQADAIIMQDSVMEHWMYKNIADSIADVNVI